MTCKGATGRIVRMGAPLQCGTEQPPPVSAGVQAPSHLGRERCITTLQGCNIRSVRQRTYVRILESNSGAPTPAARALATDPGAGGTRMERAGFRAGSLCVSVPTRCMHPSRIHTAG